MIKNLYGDEIIYPMKADVYGGVDITITMNTIHKENLRWLENFRKEYEEERRLRESNPAVKNAWEQYQVVKILAQKDNA